MYDNLSKEIENKDSRKSFSSKTINEFKGEEIFLAWKWILGRKRDIRMNKEYKKAEYYIRPYLI